MNRGADLDQQKVVQLDRGLFFVSYKSAEDTSAPPRVMVTPAPGHERRVELILHPDADEAVLWQPNSALVVRVDAPATLHVQVLPLRPGGSRAAAVRIEPITPGSPPSLARPSNSFSVASGTRTSSPAATNSGLSVLAHVAGRGDIVVGQNDWIAGPSAPARIEGIMINWPDMPAGFDFRYAVQFPNSQAGGGKMVPLGTFAGTRGRALPITGIVLELSGNEGFHFVAEAVFLSAPTLRATGKRVMLSGPSGREPLVGLRINVEAVLMPEDIAPPVIAEPAKQVRSEAASGRVRVFRSRPRQDATPSGPARSLP